MIALYIVLPLYYNIYDIRKELCTNMHMHEDECIRTYMYMCICTCMYSVPLLSTSGSHITLTINIQHMCTLFAIIFEIRIDNQFLVRYVLVCTYLIIWDVRISAVHAYL